MAAPNMAKGGNMITERRNAANQIATKLFAAEAAIDCAIVALGDLATAMPQAQAAAKLSSVVGSDAYNHLGAAVTALFEGRSRAVALHHALDEVKTGIGLRNFRVVGTGDAGKILRPEGRNDDAEAAEQASQAA
ncbi:hypothetical protein [Sphingopyxis panaciterrae]